MSTAKTLAGRAAVITGSNRNIGRAIAIALAREGASVVVNARTDVQGAQETAALVEAAGGQALVHLADISQENQANGLVAAAVERFGRLDIAISNAGVRRETPITQISLAEWREVLSVALDGAFLLCRAAIPHLMESDNGRIVTIGGSPSHMGTPLRSHVCASKMGLVGFTRSLAMELGPNSITANCVAPGVIDTTRGAAAGTRDAVRDNRPIPRKGAAEEVAAMVCHLCKPEGGYITGQVIHVNGGQLLAGA